MTVVEMGEMAYAEVSSHDFDVDAVLSEMSIDELWEAVEDEGTYVTVSYHVNVVTPDRDEYLEFEEEIFVDTEQAAERLKEAYNEQLNQNSGLRTKIREMQDRINELERPCRVSEVSEITKAISK